MRTRQPYADEVLSDALAVGSTVAAAARAAGVSERTAYRRLKDPAVRARITEVRGAALDAAAGKLSHGMVAATDRLTTLVGHANPHVQIRAAQAVIQFALQVRKEVDREGRLDHQEAPARRPAVVPVFPDEGPRPAALGPTPVDGGSSPIDPPAPPLAPAGPGGDADIPAAGERSPVGNASMSEMSSAGGPDSWESVGNPARPSSPGPADPACQASDQGIGAGVGPARPGRDVRRWAVTSGLLLLVGLILAGSDTETARLDPQAGATPPRQTCQNLTEPANETTRQYLEPSAAEVLPTALGERPCRTGKRTPAVDASISRHPQRGRAGDISGYRLATALGGRHRDPDMPDLPVSVTLDERDDADRPVTSPRRPT